MKDSSLKGSHIYNTCTVHNAVRLCNAQKLMHIFNKITETETEWSMIISYVTGL